MNSDVLIVPIVTIYFTIFLLMFGVGTTKKKNDKRLEKIESRLELKELVDTFSILADKKDVKEQMNLFTEDSVVETFKEGISSSKLKGKEEIGKAFSNFLSSFETVYHTNGQQVVTIDEENTSATGISYCLVILISEQEGKKVKTTLGVSYEDEYVKENEKWLISNRKSYFNWQIQEAI